MTGKKRERRIGFENTPKTSPNKRDLKQQRSVDSKEKSKTKDTEMKTSDKNDLSTTNDVSADLLGKFDKATDEWKRWITIDEIHGWEISTVPGPTENWNALSNSKKKDAHGLMECDLQVNKWPLVIKDGWKDITSLYGVEKNLPFGDQLGKSLNNDRDTMFGKKYGKAFKCMLALSKTDLQIIPGVKEHDGKQFLKSSVISELWIASIQVFGCTKEESPQHDVVFSDLEDIVAPTKAWDECDTTYAIGFTKETLFTEGDDGAHDLCRSVKNLFLKKGHKQAHWKQLFEAISKKSELDSPERKALKLALKMAKTDPKILDGWKGSSLYETEISAAWSGSYQVFGGVWNYGVRFGKQPSSALKQSKYKTTTKPTDDTNGIAQEKPGLKLSTSNPYFVVKKAPTAPKGNKAKKTHWTQVTYLKLRLSSYWCKQISSYPDALTNVLTEWAGVVDMLCARDPKCTAVLPWSDRDFGRAPLRKESTKPLTKDGVAKVYTDDFFLSTRQGGQFLRFRLGHTKPIEFYLESNEMLKGLSEDSSLHVDKIQDSNVSIAGWGAGSVVGKGTIEDTEEMLKSHPLFTSNQIKYIEIRVQQVRLKQGIWIKGEPRPLAIHFFVRSRDTAKARKVLNAIYPSKPRKDYPGGVQWRFVTNVADPYFPKTPKSMKKAERLRAKQEQFNREIDSVSTQNIKNLHHCLAVAPFVTLAQVLMNWRSAKDPEKRLYLHVEHTYEETKLFYHSSVAEEASQLAPFLPIILEQEYGPRAWNWFDERAKDYLGGYEYDLDKHKIIMRDEDINEDVGRGQ